jgi:hypothetical protein
MKAKGKFPAKMWYLVVPAEDDGHENDNTDRDRAR